MFAVTTGFICLWALVLQVKDFMLIKHYTQKPTNTKLPVFLLCNIMTFFSGNICFGRPYLPTAVSFFGLFILAFGGLMFPGLAEWADKFFSLLSALSLILEYCLICIRHWSKSNQGKELMFLLIVFLIFLVGFSFCCYRYADFKIFS